MKKFDLALEDCLDRRAHGEGLEECLRRYPRFAGRLRPLLQAASELESAVAPSPSEAFKQNTRAALISRIQAPAHQPGPVRPHGATVVRSRSLKPSWRLSLGLVTAAVLAFFSIGTAMAQSALPGQSLYGWKLTSEQAWLAVSPDHVAANLVLAQRRAGEALAVTGTNRQVALQGYNQVLTRLADVGKKDPDANKRILPALTVQHDLLANSGISDPNLDEYLSQPAPAANGAAIRFRTRLFHPHHSGTNHLLSLPSSPSPTPTESSPASTSVGPGAPEGMPTPAMTGMPVP